MLESLLFGHGYTLALAATSGFAVLGFLIAIFNGRALLQLRRKQLQEAQRVQQDMRALAKSAVGMGQKVLETERKLNDALKKQFAILNSQPEHPSYDQATRLIAMGASEQDLMNSCGFSQAEAELLFSLNKQGQGRNTLQ